MEDRGWSDSEAVHTHSPSSILHAPSSPPPSPSVSPRLCGEKNTQEQNGFEKLKLVARDIKLSHTVFAMPWAILAAFMAAGGLPKWGQLGLIALCMVTARTAAMTANRLLDARLDAMNARTAGRAIPSGKLSPRFMLAATLAASLVFIASTAGFLHYLNPWPLIFSLPVLAFLCAYPLLKRFTRLCHYYLGAALALAPVCAWIAIAGTLDWPPILMAAAVLLWTAGFDIIYACQDFESDIATGVFSVPAKVGIAKALWIARLTHGLCVMMLIALGLNSDALSVIYFFAVGVAGVLLLIEHWLVRADDLSKVGLAFFTLNGFISLTLGAAGLIDVFVR